MAGVSNPVVSVGGSGGGRGEGRKKAEKEGGERKGKEWRLKGGRSSLHHQAS